LFNCKPFLYLTLLAFSLSTGCAPLKTIKNKLSIRDKRPAINEQLREQVVYFDNIKNPSFIQVKENIVSEGLNFKSLKAKVDITIESPEIEGAFRCNGNLVLEKPEKIRVIGSKLASTVFDMLSDGEDFWYYIPKEKKVYTGKCKAVHSANDNVHIYPDDIAEFLNYDKLFEGRFAFMETWPTFWSIHVFDIHVFGKKGKNFVPYSRLKIDRIENRVTELTLFNEESIIKAHATYGDYSIIENHGIPTAIQITWPQARTTLNMAFKDLIINETLKPEIFQFKKPKRADIVKIN